MTCVNGSSPNGWVHKQNNETRLPLSTLGTTTTRKTAKKSKKSTTKTTPIMSSIFKLAPVKHTSTTLKPAKDTSTLSVREDNILEDPAADFTRTPSPTPHPRGTLSSLSLKRKRNLYGKRSVRSTESAHSEATTATSGRSKDSVSLFIYFIVVQQPNANIPLNLAREYLIGINFRED